VAENIALGLDAPDLAAVERAARLAGAHDFVAALPHGYAERVGERGARLSGGQRQRVGIARALYHDPDVIVFDEATSALDDETQAAVMRALRALSGRRTLILIAHRLSTLEGADAVHVLEAGRIVASGPPETVLPGLGTAA
jgi:ATP-binding cassette, subfamily B, bacterial PglK